ncbi:hypothetical protein [Leptospira abararensis]|uniref:hypothetical protein n=1 Tax=Leptospira abararensis TaxID=2810036 RepID=UPI0019637CA8|nr:hypothetical protein [Leptospira abararensis]
MRIILRCLVLFVIAFSFLKLIGYVNSNQSRILLENMSFSATDPPTVGPWLYRDIYYQLGCFLVFVLVGVVYLFVLPQDLRLHQDRFRNLILYIVMIVVLLTIKLKADSYLPLKKYFVIAFVITLYFLFITRPNVFQNLYDRFTKRMDLAILGLVFVSTIQRFTALYFDPFSLIKGDDPETYFSAAKALFSGQDLLNGSFSRGMTWFLFHCFQLFGEGQLVPKIMMILIGAVGLYCLLRFTLDYTGSKAVTILVALFYLFSSHYISFSNQFWNENLFHPIFSIYLFLLFKSKSGKNVYKKLIHGITVLFLALVLSEFRSWFPLVFIVSIVVYYANSIFRISNVVYPVCLLFFYFVASTGGKERIDSSVPLIASSSMEFNFLVGNNPYTQGTYSRHWLTYSEEVQLSKNKDEIFQHILQINLKNPQIIIQNLWKKTVLWLWGAGGPRPLAVYYQNPLSLSQTLYRCLLTVFLFLGIYQLVIKKEFLICFLYLIIFWIHLVFFADYRFTLTAMPLQAILVSYGLFSIVKANWFRNSFLKQNDFLPN